MADKPPKAPTPTEKAKVAPVAPKTPDTPKAVAKTVKEDKAVATKREEYKRAITRVRNELVRMIGNRPDVGLLERRAALNDIKSFIGQMTASLEAYEAGQMTTFEVSRKIGNLFNVQVGQDFIIGQGEANPGPVANPYKLKFRVAVEPLGLTLGYEQHNKEDSSAGLAKKSVKYLEVTVYDNGNTGVNLYFEREDDSTSGEKVTTDTATASLSHGGTYGEFSYSLPPGLGPGQGAVNFLLSQQVGNFSIGGYFQMNEVGRPSASAGLGGGVSVLGTF